MIDTLISIDNKEIIIKVENYAKTFVKKLEQNFVVLDKLI
jgi:hypothetical protein